MSSSSSTSNHKWHPKGRTGPLIAASNLNYTSWILSLVLLQIGANTFGSIHCFPHQQNIKIQVNSQLESQQKAPYLIEAIRRANDAERAANLALAQQSASSNPNERHYDSSESSKIINQGSANYGNVIREETIEEMMDLKPESVLRLSPESLIDSVIAQSGGNYAKPTDDMVGLVVANDQSSMEGDDRSVFSSMGESSLMSPSALQQQPSQQLPVTSSHHKRPPIKLAESDRGGDTQQSGGQLQPVKSNVSPSVLVDSADAGPATITAEKKPANQAPDTWEPNQVMQGVTNSSAVPATVKREYGHQVRTRVTLGGGYVRDKISNDPLAPIASSGDDLKAASSNNKPVVLKSSTTSLGADELPTRIIEVPERIVLPASALTNENITRDRHVQSTSISTSSSSSSSSSSSIRQPALNNKIFGNNNSSTLRAKPDPRCPNRGSTTIEHPSACDKYYQCENGYSIEQTCPNGLLYGTRDFVKDHCVHRWQVVCGDKSIPNPISTPGCRWQYGIFMVQGSPRCTPDYYECIEGSYEVKKCSISGQIYDDRTKSCQYAERVGCADEALGDFQCPPDDQANTYWPFPRYFLNDQALIHCVNDKPAIVRCREDERVDPEHLHCVPTKKRKQQDEKGDAESGETQSDTGAEGLATRRATTRKEDKKRKAKESTGENN